MADGGLGHEAAKYVQVATLASGYESLYVFLLVAAEYSRRYQAEFKLQPVHQQARHPSVSVGPRMYGNEMIVSVKTLFVELLNGHQCSLAT